MEEKMIEKALEEGRVEPRMPKNKEAAREAVLKAALARIDRRPLSQKLLPALAMMAVFAAGIILVIEDNTNQGKLNALGGIWCTYDDHFQGGNSVVWPPASTMTDNNFVKSGPGYGGKGYAVRITGTAGTKLGWDYAGVNTFLSSRSSCPDCAGVNISVYRGAKFKVKGDLGGGSLYFIVPYEGRKHDTARNTCVSLTNYADYEADITQKVKKEWGEVKVEFRKDMKQPSWAKKEELVGIDRVLSDARLVKWHYKGGKNGGRYDIWIDDLVFY